MGAELLNVLEFQTVLLLSQVLRGKFFLQLLYLGCTSNHRSITFWYLLHLPVQCPFCVFWVFIVDEVGAKQSGYTITYWHSWKLFWTGLWGSACSTDEAFSGKKQNFWSWDYSPQVLDYQDFQVLGCRIKGILLYIQQCTCSKSYYHAQWQKLFL